MSIECVTTAYGPPAHEALAAAVAEVKAVNPLAPVTVVVPNHYVGIAARRSLTRRANGSSRGIAAVSFHTPYSLAEHVAGEKMAAEGRPGVSNAVLAAAVRQTLRGTPGYFKGVESHPATERALVTAHRALSDLDAGQMASLAQGSARTRDVVRIHQSVASTLERTHRNEQQLARNACEVLNADPQAARSRLGEAVVVFLPQHLTSSQAELLLVAAGCVDTKVVAPATGNDEADATVDSSLRRLGLELEAVSQVGAADPRTHSEIRALSVSDADEEVRHAVRAIVDAARRGTPLGRCAIVYGIASPYMRMITDALDAAGIPRCGTTTRTAETSRLGRSLIELLGLHERGFSRRDVMTWLSDAPVSVPSAAWEQVARAARVERGIDSWEQRLARFSEDCDADAARLLKDSHRRQGLDEQQQHRVDRLQRRSQLACDLWNFVERLYDSLEPPSDRLTWTGLAKWCRFLVGEYLGEGLRRGWPEEERRLAEKVDSIIGRLGSLDDIDDEPSLVTFKRALQLELSDANHRHGSLGTGVLVGPMSLALGQELDLLVVCGMSEGVFPKRPNDDALLPDLDRRLTGGALPTRLMRSGDDRRALLGAIAGAARVLQLSPRGNLRQSADRPPSRWLVQPDVRKLPVPSFVGGLRSTAFPVHRQEYDTRCLLDWFEDVDANGKRQHDLATLDTVTLRRELAYGIELTQQRSMKHLTRFDGNLAAGRPGVLAAMSPLAVTDMSAPPELSEVTSATRLEGWSACPFAYLMRNILRVEPVDDPDVEYRLSRLERGSVAHRILELWLTEAIDAGEVPAPDEPWSHKWRERLVELGEQECDGLSERGLVGRPLYWEYDRRQMLAELQQIPDFDDKQRAKHRSTPVAAELGFGRQPGAHEPVPVDLGGGRRVRLSGSIDRVDTLANGGHLVIDYKTGKSADFKKLSDDNPKGHDPTLGGKRLQLTLYDAAVRHLAVSATASPSVLRGDRAAGRGAYWFVSFRGGFVEYGYDVQRAQETVLDAVRVIVDGIDAGLYPMRPKESSWGDWVDCPYCDPDGIGTRDLRRSWEQKALGNSANPVLARYVTLVEPKLVQPAATGDNS